MSDARSSRRPFGFGPPRPERRSIAELIRAGTLDAELAALVWLLVEARVPVVVAAAQRRAGKTTLLEAVQELLPSGTRRVELAGAAETFDWLPHATDLGWSGGRGAEGDGRATEAADPGSTWLVAHELSDHLPSYVWGDTARVAVRALSLGYGLGTTIHADSLEDVFDTLRRPPVGLTDDELTRLGVVLVLRALADGDGRPAIVRRVVAAHYVRPLARDAHGHVQRLGPAVLATWDPSGGGFEHFAWGVMPELADRVGRRAGDFEVELERRREYLAGLAEGGVVGVDEVRAAIDGYRAVDAARRPN